MSPRYRLTPNARDDVDAIGAFIAEENLPAALRVLDDPASMPLTVVAVLHGARDIEQILRDVD